MFDDRADQIVDTGNAVACALLSRAKAKSQRAWDTLVDLFGEMIYRWCREFGLNPSEARDVGREVFAAIADSDDPCRRTRDHGSLCRWIRAVTDATIEEYCCSTDSSRKTESAMDLAVSEAKFDDALDLDLAEDDRELFIRILDYARDQISSEHWQVFWQVTVEGHKPADVASRFQLARHQIYVIKSQVLWLLRDHFECDVLGGGT